MDGAEEEEEEAAQDEDDRSWGGHAGMDPQQNDDQTSSLQDGRDDTASPEDKQYDDDAGDDAAAGTGLRRRGRVVTLPQNAAAYTQYMTPRGEPPDTIRTSQHTLQSHVVFNEPLRILPAPFHARVAASLSRHARLLTILTVLALLAWTQPQWVKDGWSAAQGVMQQAALAAATQRQADVAALTARVVAVETTLTNAQVSIDAMKRENTVLKAEVAALKAVVKGADTTAAVVALRGSVDIDISKLRGDVKSITTQVSRQEDSVGSLSRAFNASAVAAATQAAALQEAVSGINSTLVARLVVAEGAVVAVRQEVNVTSQGLIALQADVINVTSVLRSDAMTIVQRVATVEANVSTLVQAANTTATLLEKVRSTGTNMTARIIVLEDAAVNVSSTVGSMSSTLATVAAAVQSLNTTVRVSLPDLINTTSRSVLALGASVRELDGSLRSVSKSTNISIEALNTSIIHTAASLLHNVTVIRTEAAALASNVTVVQAHLQRLDTVLSNSSNSTVDTAQALNARIGTLSVRVDAVESDVNATRQDVRTLHANMSQLHTDVQELTITMEAVNASSFSRDDTLTSTVSATQLALDGVNASVVAVATSVAAHENTTIATLAALISNVTKLQHALVDATNASAHVELVATAGFNLATAHENELSAALASWNGTLNNGSRAMLRQAITTFQNTAAHVNAAFEVPPSSNPILHSITYANGSTTTDAASGTALQRLATSAEVHNAVLQAVFAVKNDDIGWNDYASLLRGAVVVGAYTSPSAYSSSPALSSVLMLSQNAEIMSAGNSSASAALMPDVHPGMCFAFNGGHGNLTVRLSSRIRVTGFTIDHIPQASSHVNRTSAPRGVILHGVRTVVNEDREEMYGGSTPLSSPRVYDITGPPIQTFLLNATMTEAFQFVTLEVNGNYGADTTCLYRLRVHGVPSV